MASREVYSCDNCKRDLDPKGLTGMTASVTITPAGKYATEKYGESKDYCDMCRDIIKGKMIEAFEKIMGSSAVIRDVD